MMYGKYFMIASEDSGLVLDVKGGSTDTGTDVIMWEQSGNDNQIWYEHPTTGTIRSKLSDLCLDFDTWNRLVVEDYDKDSDSQRWRYNSDRMTIDSYNSNKVFDVVEGKKEPGTKVCAYEYHGGDNQRWRIEPVATSFYFFIKSKMNGKVLDIEGAETSSGAKVIMYGKKDSGDADNQLWFEDRYGNIRSKLNPSLVLDGSGDCLRTSEFDSNNPAQYWCVDGDTIVNRYDTRRVLDIKEGDDDDGAELCAYNFHGSDNQRWEIEFA